MVLPAGETPQKIVEKPCKIIKGSKSEHSNLPSLRKIMRQSSFGNRHQPKGRIWRSILLHNPSVKT